MASGFLPVSFREPVGTEGGQKEQLGQKAERKRESKRADLPGCLPETPRFASGCLPGCGSFAMIKTLGHWTFFKYHIIAGSAF